MSLFFKKNKLARVLEKKEDKNQSDDSNRFIRAVEQTAVHDHLCVIYKTKQEEFAAAVPFIRVGLEHGEKCIYVVDENSKDEVLAGMRAGGITIDAALEKGDFSIITKNEAYLRHGYFDPDEMIAFLKENTDLAKKEGYTALRVTGEMTWVLGGAPGSDKLIEYEAKLNRFFPKNDCVALCQYDRNFFSPEILTGVIHTHPTVVVGGVMCKNFYYIPVDEFLKSGMNSSEEVDRLLKNLIDRERMESEIRSIEEKYRRIVTSANQGVWIIDRDFKITFVNPRICEMMGYAEQELLGHRIDEFISSEELIDNAKKMKEGHSEKMDTYDRRCMRKDGEMIWVTISATPLFDSKNVFEGALNMITDITQRKQIENELRESEEKFSAAFTASPDAIVITRLKDGVIVEINEAFTKLFGFTRKQARGVSAVDLSIWVDTKDRSVFIDTLVKEKEIDNWEVQLRRKDGSIITVIDSARVISFQNVDCVLSVIRDISDRKRTEMELASLNRFLRMVSDVNQTLIRATEEMSLLVGTCRIVVEEGGYRLAWVGMMEYDEEKTVKPVALAGFGAEYTKRANISWADNEQGRGPTGTAIRTGKTVISIDIARDPRMVPWQASAAEFGYKSSIALPLLQDGTVFGALTVYSGQVNAFTSEEVKILEELSNDLAFGIVTLRRRNLQLETAKEARKLAMVVENTFNAVAIADFGKTNTLLYVNPSWEHMLGYTKEEVVNKKLAPALEAIKRYPEVEKEFWKCIEDGKTFSGELEMQRKNGTFFWIAANIIPLKDEAGNVYTWCNVFRDITNEKAVDRMKSEFVSLASHQLRTPLTGIKWLSEIVMSDPANVFTKSGREAMDGIVMSNERMISLVNDLLDVSHLETGVNYNLVLKPTDVIPLIQGAITDVKHLASKNNVTVVSDAHAPRELILNIDGGKIQQVLENLIGNAIKYSKPNTNVVVKVIQESDRAVFSVADRGIGIPSEQQTLVFTRFFRANNASKVDISGTGLGLYIVKGIIETHHGKVWFESKEGEGSTFYFSLPMGASALISRSV